MRFYAEFQKAEEQADGTLEVSGIASTGNPDSSGETVLPDAIKAALPEYLKFPALREMHGLSAAGSTLDAQVDADGVTRIVAKVVDPVAIKKVAEGVYRGFSIGGKVLGRDPQAPKTITKIRLSEISLVDRPCNPEAVMDLWKAEGADMAAEDTKPAPGDEAPVAKPADAQASADASGPQGAAATPPEDAPAQEAAAEPAVLDPVAKAESAVAALKAAVDAGKQDRLAKGMYEVSRFAEVLSSVAYVLSELEYEADYEGDNSPVPAKLRSWLTAGAAVLKEMAVEEVDELIARVTTQKAEAAAALGKAEAAAPDTALGERLNKAEADLARRDEALAKLAEQVEALTSDIAALRTEPLPPKTAALAKAVAIGKEEDAAGSVAAPATPSADALAKALAGMSDEDRTLLLIKAAHKTPRLVAAA